MFTLKIKTQLILFCIFSVDVNFIAATVPSHYVSNGELLAQCRDLVRQITALDKEDEESYKFREYKLKKELKTWLSQAKMDQSHLARDLYSNWFNTLSRPEKRIINEVLSTDFYLFV